MNSDLIEYIDKQGDWMAEQNEAPLSSETSFRTWSPTQFANKIDSIHKIVIEDEPSLILEIEKKAPLKHSPNKNDVTIPLLANLNVLFQKKREAVIKEITMTSNEN